MPAEAQNKMTKTNWAKRIISVMSQPMILAVRKSMHNTQSMAAILQWKHSRVKLLSHLCGRFFTFHWFRCQGIWISAWLRCWGFFSVWNVLYWRLLPKFAITSTDIVINLWCWNFCTDYFWNVCSITVFAGNVTITQYSRTISNVIRFCWRQVYPWLVLYQWKRWDSSKVCIDEESIAKMCDA